MELARQLSGQFDALLVSCAGIRVSPVIEEIERMLDVPVVTSNAALLWYCLSKLRISERPQRYGSLFAIGANCRQ
jgi:maleate isomerase